MCYILACFTGTQVTIKAIETAGELTDLAVDQVEEIAVEVASGGKRVIWGMFSGIFLITVLALSESSLNRDGASVSSVCGGLLVMG